MRGAERPGKLIVWLIVATIVLLTGVSTALSLRHANQSNAQVRDRSLEAVEATAAAVDQFLAQRLSVLSAIASLPRIIDGTAAEQDEYFASVDLARVGFEGGLGIVTLDGVMDAWTAAPSADASQDVSDRTYFQAVRDTGQPFVGEAVVTRTSGYVVVPIAIPVSATDGSVVRILVGALRLDGGGDASLLSLLREGVTVVDRAGQVIVRDGAVAGLVSVVDKPGYAALRSTTSGLDEDAVDLAGEPDQVVSYAAVDRGGWVIVHDEPRRAAFGSAWSQFVIELTVKGWISIMALIAGLVAANRLDRSVAAQRRTASVLTAQGRVLELIALRRPLPEVLASVENEFGALIESPDLRERLGSPADAPSMLSEGQADEEADAEAAVGEEREALLVASHLVEIAMEQDRVAAARDETERQIRRLVDSNILGVFTAEIGGRLLEANDNFLTMLGYTQADLADGLIDWAAVTPDEWMMASQVALQELDARGKFLPYEKDYRTKDGGRVPVLVGGVVVREGVLTGYALDLTDLQLAQAETVRSEHRYRALVEASSAAVWKVVPGLRYGDVNPWWRALTGQNSEAMEGIGWAAPIHPDDRQRTVESITSAMARGLSFLVDYRVLDVAGSYRHLESRGVPLPYGEWVGTYVDVTEEKAQAQALRISEERLRLALEAAELGSWDWDLITGAVTWSPVIERNVGLEPGGFAGTIEAFTAFVHPDDRALVSERSRRSIAEICPFSAEFRMTRVDGSIRWTRTSGRILTDASGRAVRLVGIDVDITEEKGLQSERQLFLASVAHDLKNPIAVLKASAQLLQRKVARGIPMTPEDSLTRLAVIETNATRLAARLDDLNDLAQLEAGLPVQLEIATVDLIEVVKRSVESISRLTVAHEVRMDTRCGSLTGWWDENRIERVIDNLIGNAVKYSPGGGVVFVEVWSDGVSAFFSVRDEGIGIPSAEQSSIFEFRRRGSNVGTIDGSGIGLAGAHRLVELAGGEITMTSSENEGSTFVVRLPLASADAPVAIVAPVAAVAAR